MAENMENNELEVEVLTLTDEDGVESDFEVIGDMEIDGKIYRALIPVDEDGDEFVILRLEADADGVETLVTIDDDDEFDKVADMFEDALVDERYYDECDGECDGECDHCHKED